MQNADQSQLVAAIAAALQQINNPAADQAAPAPQAFSSGRRSGSALTQTRGVSRRQGALPGQTRSGISSSSQISSGEPFVSEANRALIAQRFYERRMHPALPASPIVFCKAPDTAGKAARERRLLLAASLPELFGRTISREQLTWIRDNIKPLYSKICAHAQAIKVDEWRANQAMTGGLRPEARQERGSLKSEARELQTFLQAESKSYRARTSAARHRLQQVQVRLATLGISTDASSNDLAGPAYLEAGNSVVPTQPSSLDQAAEDGAEASDALGQEASPFLELDEDNTGLSD